MDKVVAKLDESIRDDRDSSLIASNGSAIRRCDSWRVSLLYGPFLTRLTLEVWNFYCGGHRMMEFLLWIPLYERTLLVVALSDRIPTLTTVKVEILRVSITT